MMYLFQIRRVVSRLVDLATHSLTHWPYTSDSFVCDLRSQIFCTFLLKLESFDWSVDDTVPGQQQVSSSGSCFQGKSFLCSVALAQVRQPQVTIPAAVVLMFALTLPALGLMGLYFSEMRPETRETDCDFFFHTLKTSRSYHQLLDMVDKLEDMTSSPKINTHKTRMVCRWNHHTSPRTVGVQRLGSLRLLGRLESLAPIADRSARNFLMMKLQCEQC